MHESISRCVKRSFRRACKRAIRDGSTFYRGRCLTRQQVLTDPSSAASVRGFGAFRSVQTHSNQTAVQNSAQQTNARVNDQVSTQNPCGAPDLCKTSFGRRTGQCHRLGSFKCFSWNVGGLTSGRLDNLFAWLEHKQVHIALLQETRWTYDSEWVSGSFSIIHYGGSKEDRFCGLLIAIHHSICKPQLVRHACYIPGRLVHIRICHPKSSQYIDLVHCYQYFGGSLRDIEDSKLERQMSFLDSLGQIVAGLPRRNILLVAGDFQHDTSCVSPPSWRLLSSRSR